MIEEVGELGRFLRDTLRSLRVDIDFRFNIFSSGLVGVWFIGAKRYLLRV